MLYRYDEDPSEGFVLVLCSGSGPEEILICDVTHVFEFQNVEDSCLCFGRRSKCYVIRSHPSESDFCYCFSSLVLLYLSQSVSIETIRSRSSVIFSL